MPLAGLILFCAPPQDQRASIFADPRAELSRARSPLPHGLPQLFLVREGLVHEWRPTAIFQPKPHPAAPGAAPSQTAPQGSSRDRPKSQNDAASQPPVQLALPAAARGPSLLGTARAPRLTMPFSAPACDSPTSQRSARAPRPPLGAAGLPPSLLRWHLQLLSASRPAPQAARPSNEAPSPSQQVCTVVALGLAAAPPSP
mmetsp:Transcript_60623/g.144469  ORF Transcript_60623/g.144469 Transcript_60623/m.144469 type:complete len:200 (-) Transcript_60623:390-989(-)